MSAETIAVVPLHAQNLHVIGVLVVTALEPHWLSDDRRQVLLSLSDQCGLALDRADLQTSAERAAADAALLARLSDALDRSTTAKERARHVVGELMVRGAGSVAIELADEDGHTVLAVGGPTHELSSPELVVPLQARGRVLGRISIGSGDLGPTGRSLVQAIASRAAIAIDNALLYERERDVSHRPVRLRGPSAASHRVGHGCVAVALGGALDAPRFAVRVTTHRVDRRPRRCRAVGALHRRSGRASR